MKRVEEIDYNEARRFVSRVSKLIDEKASHFTMEVFGHVPYVLRGIVLRRTV